MIKIIDYGCGNLFSIGQSLQYLNLPHTYVQQAQRLATDDVLLLPGVGAFPDAMASMQARGLATMIQEFAARGGAIVGMCLGMQLLLSSSEEFDFSQGLNLIPGQVKALPVAIEGARVPNTGWRKINTTKPDELIQPLLATDFYLYFMHAYMCIPQDPQVTVATSEFACMQVPAIIHQGNIWGIQAHPEKSAEYGLALLKRILVDAY